MRWNNLLANPDPAVSTAPLELELGLPHATVRTFPTPEFQGITFYEIYAKSIINRVSSASNMPFQWTINPYRGCTHKCRYCFARPSHDYLGMNIGEDFDSKIVVKVNAAELLRVELAKKTWRGEAIAMGTNVDPYQRAEGKYQLMRGILEELCGRANPFSILTKGTLILRDLDLLTYAARVSHVRIGVSIGFVDPVVWRQLEAGAPSPRARLGVCKTLQEAGVGCGVLMAPILPYLTDSDDQLEATVAGIAKAGARSVTPLVLHLRPGVREWYFAWLQKNRPELVNSYQRLYVRGAYAPKDYTSAITQRVYQIAKAYGIKNSAQRRYRRQARENTTNKQPHPGRTAKQSSTEEVTTAEITQLSML
jgi:DNA repair photolyase